MPAPEEVYLLMRVTGGIDVVPQVAHTTNQGAAMEMVSYPPEEQRNMWVESVRLVDDGDN
jgi:hypothetical protein